MNTKNIKSLKSEKNNKINNKQSAIERKLEQRGSIAEHLKSSKDYSDDKIDIPSKFLTSIIDYENKFTNKIDLRKDNSHILQNLKLIINDVEYVIRNSRQVTVDRNNRKRLKSIISKYDKKWIDEDDIEGENLFKVNGEKTKILLGDKEEYQNTFRVYLRVYENDEGKKRYKLIFIDPYHLAILAHHQLHHPEVMQERNFVKHKYCTFHLHKLLEQIDQ